MGDVNLQGDGVLLDMAALAGDSQRGWDYTRAAKAVLRLDQHITPLIHTPLIHANTFKAVFVVASPHSLLRKSIDQTARMVGAVSQPGVCMLGHPQGRRFNLRPGVSADWDQVFEVAARREVAIEIDGSWDRQDVHYELAARALSKGCLFALDSDAHSHPELDFIDIAIAHARLAAIPQERIINYWTEAKFLKWARGAWER